MWADFCGPLVRWRHQVAAAAGRHQAATRALIMWIVAAAQCCDPAWSWRFARSWRPKPWAARSILATPTSRSNLTTRPMLVPIREGHTQPKRSATG